MARGRHREERSQHLVLRALASAPARLVVGVLVLVVISLALVPGIKATTVAIPHQVADTSGRPALPQSAERLIAVLDSDQLTPEYISAIQRITERAETTQGVARVRSVTNSLVLIKNGLQVGATPPVGPRSVLPLEVPLVERAQMASAARLGSGDLISADGRTTAVVAELQLGQDDEQRARTAEQFEEVVTSEAEAAGIGITSHVAGDTYTANAATEGLRSDYATIVYLACILPALIALALLRGRVPGSAVLAAGGAALLLAAVLSTNIAATDVGLLPADHPIAQGNRIVDERLHGMIPIEVEFTGRPDDFRKPEVLARLDALANWLRDEYGVKATGLSSTVRDETGVITGVDSVPPNPDDLATLLAATAEFDDGTFLPNIVTDDYSRTRLIGSWPNRGADAVVSMERRFDRIASAELADTGIVARLTAKVPTAEPATEALNNALGILGALAIALAATLGLLGFWARHALHDRERWLEWDDDADDDGEPETSSLFARGAGALHGHGLGHRHRRALDDVPS